MPCSIHFVVNLRQYHTIHISNHLHDPWPIVTVPSKTLTPHAQDMIRFEDDGYMTTALYVTSGCQRQLICLLMTFAILAFTITNLCCRIRVNVEMRMLPEQIFVVDIWHLRSTFRCTNLWSGTRLWTWASTSMVPNLYGTCEIPAWRTLGIVQIRWRYSRYLTQS